MVLLYLQGLDGALEGMKDHDVECTWYDLAARQLSSPCTFSTLEYGDVLAMWDRNCWADDWPGRAVFVLAADA